MGMLADRITAKRKIDSRHGFIDQDALRDFYKEDVIRRFGDENMPPEGTPEWDDWFEVMKVKDWYDIGVRQGDCTPERAAEAVEEARLKHLGISKETIDGLGEVIADTKIVLAPCAKKKKNFENYSDDETRELHKKWGVSFGKDKDGYFCYTHRARSKSYPTIADIPKSALKFIDSTGMKKVEAQKIKMEIEWDVPADLTKEQISELHHDMASRIEGYYTDPKEFMRGAKGKIGIAATAKKDTVASALEFLMSMPLYERDRNEGATVAEEIASSKHGLGPESHRIYDALCLLFVDKNAGLMFGDMPISDALDKLKEMGYDGVTRRKTEGHEPLTAAKSKTLHIWDFDGTLIDTGEFHQNRIDNPKPIKKNLERFKRQIADDEDVVVMTARGNAGLVRKTLEDAGVDMTGIRIIALGTTKNEAKGEYIAKNFASKYDTITLYDDRKAYLEAAEEAMEEKDVTFKTVKAAAKIAFMPKKWEKSYSPEQTMEIFSRGLIPLDGRKIDSIIKSIKSGKEIPGITLNPDESVRVGMHRFAAYSELGIPPKIKDSDSKNNIATRRIMSATTKKYQVTYQDGSIEFKMMTASFADQVAKREGVVAVEPIESVDKIEAAKGEYDLWGSIEKAVERGLLTYIGFMAADYLHKKKASVDTEAYEAVVGAFDAEHDNDLTDDEKAVIRSRLNEAGWDATEEGIDHLWSEIRRARAATA